MRGSSTDRPAERGSADQQPENRAEDRVASCCSVQAEDSPAAPLIRGLIAAVARRRRRCEAAVAARQCAAHRARDERVDRRRRGESVYGELAIEGRAQQQYAEGEQQDGANTPAAWPAEN